MNLTFNVSEDVIELTQQDENGDHLVQDAVRYEITGNVLTTTPRQGEGIAIELPETVDFEGVNRARAVQPDREIAIEVEVDQNSALVTVEDSPMDCTRVSN